MLNLLTPYKTVTRFNPVGNGTGFDGTNDYMLRGAALTGVADSKVGTFACRIRFNGGDAANQQILTSAGSSIDIRRKSDNRFGIVHENASGTVILNDQTTGTSYTAGTWFNLLFSWDMTGSIAQMYVNDTDDAAAASVYTNENIDYTVADYSVGASTGGGNKCNATISFLWFDPTVAVDFSVEANRRKFFDADGRPVFLGNRGQKPTGSQVAIFLNENYDKFNQNRGYGGNFSVVGSLTGVKE